MTHGELIKVFGSEPGIKISYDSPNNTLMHKYNSAPLLRNTDKTFLCINLAHLFDVAQTKLFVQRKHVRASSAIWHKKYFNCVSQ